MTMKAIGLATVAAVALAMAVPAMAQTARPNNAGQCWKATDSTKPYGYWSACPRPAARSAARQPQPTVTAPAPYAAGQPGQCWKRTDSTKPYGYWGECPPPQRVTQVVHPGPSNNPNDFYAGARPGYCFKRTDSTKRVGYWAKC